MTTDRGGSPLALAVVGTGRAGTVAAETIAKRTDLRMASWLTTDPGRVGTDAADLAAVPRGEVQLSPADDYEDVTLDADVLLYAGVNEAEAIERWMRAAVTCHIDCVSVAGPIHPRSYLGADVADSLDLAARKVGSRLLSTGVNPGFLLDVLPLACASLSPTLDIEIRGRRHSEIRDWGSSVLSGFGLGESPSSWQVDAPYVTLRESVELLVDALGVRRGEIRETYEPILSSTSRHHREWTVEPGAIAGFRTRCVAAADERPIVDLIWSGEFCMDQAPEDEKPPPEHEIRITGDMDLKCSVTGSLLIDSYPSTLGRALNSIPALRRCPPGLYRPDQIPFSPMRSVAGIQE